MWVFTQIHCICNFKIYYLYKSTVSSNSEILYLVFIIGFVFFVVFIPSKSNRFCFFWNFYALRTLIFHLFLIRKNHYIINMPPKIRSFFPAALTAISVLFSQNLAAQDSAASLFDGENLSYFESFEAALTAAAEIPSAFDPPIEITLFKDTILDAPLIINDNSHLRLLPGGADRTIKRGSSLIEYPLIWLSGDSASLTLGKPGMEHELFIDGGCLNDPPVYAECPLVNVCGPDSKLIMYDNVTLQNNYNGGDGAHNSYYQLGGGVYIRTAGDLNERQAEFIMKGGTIRGNFNNVQNYMACGGGLLIAGFGVFTMEDGAIMDNTAQFNGGGVHSGGRGTFRKTGGTIYGSNAPQGFRNTALNGPAQRKFPQIYGHAVSVTVSGPKYWFRDNTVIEDDNLSYSNRGALRAENYLGANDAFGKGEKWNTSGRVFWSMILIIILIVLALFIAAFNIVRFYFNRRFQKIQREYEPVKIDYEGLGFTPREREICELLLTEIPIKNIPVTLSVSKSTVNFHTRNLYRKLNIQSRTELFVKLGTLKNKK